MKDVVCDVHITNGDKLLFENITKLDVVNYYEKVAEKMLPFLQKRLLSVVRLHSQNLQEKFFKKHPKLQEEGNFFEVTNEKGKTKNYFYITTKKQLITQAQLGTIEFHTWGSSIPKINSPDVMVFDLDPDENLSLEKLRQGVKDLKSILDTLGLKSFLKTSGGKGYHIVLPFKKSDWNSFSSFSKNVAVLMEQKWKTRYTSNIRKEKRKNRIFIDWIRNSKGATSVAPYSLRAKLGAGVSVPIFWNELDKIAPDELKMQDVLKRLDENPWKDFFKVKQKLICKKWC